MRYKQEYVNKDGWTNWISPVRKNYRIKCCKCGLTHKVNFRLVKWGRGYKIQIKVSGGIK